MLLAFARRLDGDFHILAKSSQKFHEASHGKGRRTITHQCGYVRSLNAQNVRRFSLRIAAFLYDPEDLENDVSLDAFVRHVTRRPAAMLYSGHG